MSVDPNRMTSVLIMSSRFVLLLLYWESLLVGCGAAMIGLGDSVANTKKMA
jgi:hypothetical protein